MSSYPTYAPTGAELQYLLANAGDDPTAPQGLLDEFSTLSIFQLCEPGPLEGQPLLLNGAAFLTDTITMYQMASPTSTQPPHISIATPDQPPAEPIETPDPPPSGTTSTVALPPGTTSVLQDTSQPTSSSQQDAESGTVTTAIPQPLPAAPSQTANSIQVQASAINSIFSNPQIVNPISGTSSGNGGKPAPSNILVEPTVISIGPQAVTISPGASEIIIGGQTIFAGSGITATGGTIISLSPSGSALLIGGSSINLVPEVTTFPIESALVVTAAGSFVTLTPGSPVVVDGTTINPGSPAITIAGMPVFLSPSSSILVVGGSSITIPSAPTNSPAITQPPPNPTIGPLLSLSPNSAFVFDGTTLIPGGAPITISGTPISLASSANYIYIGTSSMPLISLEYLTIGTQIFTAPQGSPFVLSGQTLIPGGAGITIGGTVVSLESVATQVVVGGSTESVGVGGLIWSGIGGSLGASSTITTGVAGGNVSIFTGEGRQVGEWESWKLLEIGSLLFILLHMEWL